MRSNEPLFIGTPGILDDGEEDEETFLEFPLVNVAMMQMSSLELVDFLHAPSCVSSRCSFGLLRAPRVVGIFWRVNYVEER